MAVNKRIRRRIYLLAILCLVLGTTMVSVYFYSRWNRQNQIDSAYEQGMVAYESGDFVTALPLLSKAAAGIKNDADLIIALGRTRLRNIDPTGRHITAAEKYFLFVLSIDSSNQQALEELVRIYAMTNNSTNTLLYSDRIDDPTPELIRMRVRVLGQNGRFDQAIEELERIRRIEPDDPIWALEMIGMRERTGEPPTSILDDIDLMMIEHPENQGLRYGKIHVLQRVGREDSALELLREFASEERIHPDIILMLGDKLGASGLEAERDAIARRIVELGRTDPGVANLIIDRRIMRGQYERALELALQASADHPNDLTFLRKAAAIVGRSQDRDRSERVYSELITRSISEDTARGAVDERMVDAFRIWSTGTPEEKRAMTPDLEKLVVLARGSGMLRLMLAEALYLDGRAVESAEMYRNLFEGTGSRDAGRRLVMMKIQERLLEEAVGYSTRLLELHPDLDSFVIQSKALIALKRARGGVPSDLPVIDDPTGISDRILTSYRSMIDRSAAGAQSLLGILVESASLENNLEVLDFAVNEALKSKEIESTALLVMARDRKVFSRGWANALAERADDLGVDETDLIMTKAVHARLDGRENDALVLADRAYEIVGNGLTEDQTGRRREILAFVANSPASDEAVGRMRRMLDDLRTDAASARIVTMYPGIWIRDPEMADMALERLGALVGDASPSFQIALGKRVALLESDDEVARARSIVALNDIVQSSPGSMEAMLVLGDLLRGGRNPNLTAAAAFLKKAVDMRPTQVDLYPDLIQLLQVTGDRERAQDYLDQYQRMSSDDSDMRSRIALHVRQGRMDEAIDELQRLAEGSGDPLDRVYLGMFLGREGRTDEAIEQYEKVEETDPENRFALHGKLLLLADSGRIEEALRIARSCDFLEAGELEAMEVEMHLAASMPQMAVPIVDDLIAERSNEVATWMIAGRVRMSNGDLPGARKAYLRALEIEPDNRLVMEKLAPILVADISTWDDAGAVLEVVGDSNPVLAEILELTMSASDRSTGSFRPSKDHLNRSLELVDRFPGAIAPSRLAWQLHEAAGRHDIGLEIGTNAMSRFQNGAEPALWAYQSALGAGDWDRAVDFAYAARSRSERNRSLLHDLRIADLCMRLGRNGEAYAALAPYEGMLGNDSELVGRMTMSDRSTVGEVTLIRRLRGLSISALIRTRRIDKAKALLVSLIADNPGLLEAWIANNAFVGRDIAIEATRGISDLLRETDGGRLREIGAWIDIARRFEEPTDLEFVESLLEGMQPDGNPMENEIRMQQAQFQVAMGNSSRAIGILEEIIDGMRRDGIGRRSASDVADADEARQVRYERSLYIMALNNHAYQAARAGELEDRETGLANIEEAIRLSEAGPRNNCIDTKASVLASLDRKAEALDLMLELRTRSPEHIGFRINTARLLIDLDRSMEARTLLDDTLQLLVTRPSSQEQASQVRSLLETAGRMTIGTVDK